MTTFSKLGLATPVLQALASEGYATPTPIQAQSIPVVLSRRDLLGIAQTGTGKTAAFALPILQLLSTDRRRPGRKGCRVLVLSPTRELATQIADSFRTYGQFLNLNVAVVFGGVPHRPQLQAMANGIDVLVATPGRLLDHIAQRNIVLRDIEIFVLDEADQMLDLGFIRPIRRIISHLPQQRQSLLFSATMPREAHALAGELLRNPARVSVAPAATTVQTVSQKVIHVDSNRKRTLLIELLSDPGVVRALVFTRTKRGADRVARHLREAGIDVAAIHGNRSQRQREQALDAFRRSNIRVLVATDIAARGLDIDEVSHVVNFELPDVAESYVHRIGRTARAGAEGAAVSFCAGEEMDQLRGIERLTRQKIPAEDRRNDARLTVDQPASRVQHRTHVRKGPRSSADQESRRRSHENDRGKVVQRLEKEGGTSRRVAPARMALAQAANDRSGMAGIAFMASPPAPAARPPAQRPQHRSQTQQSDTKRARFR